MSLFTWGDERSTKERDLLGVITKAVDKSEDLVGVVTKAVDVASAVDEAEDLV